MFNLAALAEGHNLPKIITGEKEREYGWTKDREREK